MEIEPTSIVQLASNLFDGFYHSWFFTAIKFFLAIYVAVLLVDVILLLVLRGVRGNLQTMLRGTTIPTTTKSKMMKSWEKIIQRVKSHDPSQFKVAILESDKIADEILAGIGYRGTNMGERLQQATSAQVENLEELKKAHQVRNRIIYEPEFKVDEKLAKETVETYEHFLRHMEFL